MRETHRIEAFAQQLAFLLGVLVAGLIWLACAVTKVISRSLKPREGQSDPRAEPVLAPTATPPTVINLPRDYSDYEPSLPRLVQFPDVGYLTMWAFRSQRTVRRQVVISNRDLSARLGGHRFPLPEMAWASGASLEDIEDQSIADAEVFLRDRLRVLPAPHSIRSLPLPNVAGTTSDAAAAKVSTVAALAGGHKPEANTGRPPRRGAPYAHVHQTVLERAIGRLEYAGIVKRTLASGVIQQFAVDILTPDLGLKRIHGSDLERALQDAGAKPGDQVEISCVGESKVRLPGGEEGTKKHYVAKVIG